MSGGAAVKKEEEKKKQQQNPHPFSQILYAADEKKDAGAQKPVTHFHSAQSMADTELMRDARSIEERGRISHEIGVRKELEGLKRAEERKKKKAPQHGGQEQKKWPPNDDK